MKRRSSKSHRLPSAWKLFTATMAMYRGGWWSYFKIVAIVTIPAHLIVAFIADDSTGTLNYLSTSASVIMNVALVWAVSRHVAAGKVPNLARSYYDGSSIIVRYLLVTFAYVVMLIPAAIGLVFLGTALVASGPAAITIVEELLLGFVAVLLALPSLYLVVRYTLAPIAVARDDFAPMRALQASRQLTLGYFWPVAARLILLVLFLGLVSIPTSLIVAGITFMGFSYAAMTVFVILTSIIALPILNLYLCNLYIALEKAKLPEDSASIKTA